MVPKRRAVERPARARLVSAEGPDVEGGRSGGCGLSLNGRSDLGVEV